MKKLKMKSKVGAIICCIVSICLSVNTYAKPKTPKLVEYSYTDIGSTADEIFKSLAPYTQLAPSYKKIVNTYKPLLIHQLAKASKGAASSYHVRRAAISTESEAEAGTIIIYYETIRSKNLCEVSAVTVYKSGNYSILTSVC